MKAPKREPSVSNMMMRQKPKEFNIVMANLKVSGKKKEKIKQKTANELAENMKYIYIKIKNGIKVFCLHAIAQIKLKIEDYTIVYIAHKGPSYT